MNLVTLDHIHKQYSERLLLEDAGLVINRGDRIGLIGINGSGKTTLLRIVAGLEPADAGQVTVWGNVRIHYLPQEPVLDETLTVSGCALSERLGADAARPRIRASCGRAPSRPIRSGPPRAVLTS